MARRLRPRPPDRRHRARQRGLQHWTVLPAEPSADGRFVAFTSLASDLVPGDDNGVDDVFVRDLLTGVIELVSVFLRSPGEFLLL